MLRAGPALRSTLRSSRPDVVYVNTTTIPWWILAARAARVPVLCHVHEAEDADPGPVRRLMAAPLAAADRGPVHLAAPPSGPRSRSCPGCAAARSSSSTASRSGPTHRCHPPAGPHPRLGFVSRLSERKAQHVAIAAVDILRRRGRTVELELAGTVYPGNEAYEERLRRDVREHGLEDLVTFSGYVAPSAAVFDRSDVALSLSTRDALGNVVVEAQLAERPVVAAGVGGHLESIVDGETGLHVPPGDPDAVADAVESLLADPARARQIALAGRESARGAVRRAALRRPRRRAGARAGGRAPRRR